MQISRTSQTLPKAQAEKPKVLKPLEEKWTIGEDTFNSTADLLARGGDLQDVKATYHYRAQDKAQPFTSGEKIKNAVGTGLKSSVIGGTVGLVAGTGLAFAHGMLEVLGAILRQPIQGTPNAVVWVPALIGAGIGAAVGATGGYKMEAAAPMGRVDGVLKLDGDKTNFYPNGKVENRIDLREFQDAPTPPISPAEKGEAGQVSSRLKAAGLAAAAVPLSFFPLLGQVGPPVVGHAIGSDLDKRTTLGSGIGTALGAGLTVASLATAHASTNIPMALLAGGAAIGGATLGHKIFTSAGDTPAQRNYGNQWWNQGEKDTPSY